MIHVAQLAEQQQHIRFRHQRSAVQIQSSAIFVKKANADRIETTIIMKIDWEWRILILFKISFRG